jgi:hypothetical protein
VKDEQEVIPEPERRWEGCTGMCELVAQWCGLVCKVCGWDDVPVSGS